MNATATLSDLRTAFTLELDLGGGPEGASARLELRMGESSPRGVAHVALRGCIGRVAEQRLLHALSEWVKRGIDHLVLDCRDARHLDPRRAHRLADAASHLDGVGPVEIWGLPRAGRPVATSEPRGERSS
jgi:hypothetical protein